MKDRDYEWSQLPTSQTIAESDERMGHNSQKYSIPWVFLNRRNLRCIFFSVTIIVLFMMFRYLHYNNYKFDTDAGETPSSKFIRNEPEIAVGDLQAFKDEKGHRLPYEIAVPSKSPTWYEQRCFAGGRQLGQSIADVYEKLELMKGSNVAECLAIWKIFDRMFTMELINAPIVLPEEFQSEVKGWLGDDPKLFQQVNHQKVYQVINKASFEETVFNPLRSKRPTSKSSINPLDYIANLTLSTQPSCDFCKYREHTAADTFGRIENENSASASNTFKLAKFHGLFFPKSHHPLNISREVLTELFVNTSKQWFDKAHQTDVTQRYPSLLWDALPHAGASQVHPHVHGILGVHQYTGAFENLHSISQEYFDKYKRSYWTDLILMHWALGLGLSMGKAVAIVPLFPRKDHEYMIFSSEVDQDFTGLIYSVLEGYKNNLGVYCFSSGGAYPFMGIPTAQFDRYKRPGLPVMFRFGSRGVCTTISSDVSSLDLYTVNNINSDLSSTFQALKDSIMKTSQKE